MGGGFLSASIVGWGACMFDVQRDNLYQSMNMGDRFFFVLRLYCISDAMIDLTIFLYK